MEMELEQVRLALDTDPIVLKYLKEKNVLKKDEQGEYVPIIFNSAEFRLRPKSSMLVGRTIALAVLRSNTIIIGNALTGEEIPYIKALESVNLVAPDPDALIYPCDFCDETFKTARAAARHVYTAHQSELGEGDPLDPILPASDRAPKAPAAPAKGGVKGA